MSSRNGEVAIKREGHVHAIAAPELSGPIRVDVDSEHVELPAGVHVSFADEDTNPEAKTDRGQVTEGNRIDPLVCPRGHHAVAVSSNRINCRTCRNQGRDPDSWKRSELVDLRHEEPPLDDRELRADGGRDRKRRRDRIVEAVLKGQRPSEQLRDGLEGGVA